MSNTYGTWLPGDPRGFRTRDHREHVEGDYKNPPPKGKYDRRYKAAKRRLKQPPVFLSPEQRAIALEELLCTFEQYNIEILTASVSGVHIHVLGRFPVGSTKKPTFGERGLRSSAVDDPVRHLMGIAKQWSSKRLIRDGHFECGPVWAKRGKIVPVKDRRHQVRVFNYILKHVCEGAAVWSFRDGKP